MTMLKSLAATVVLAAAVAIAPTGASAQIKVGITVSASGPGAALGQPQMRTVQALPKEIAGQKVTYIALDDESDPTKAVQNARKLITDEKVDILIGSSLTPVSLPLIDIAHETKTPLLTLAAAAVMVQPLDDKKKWVYKVVPNDDLMAKVILAYIAKSGVKKLGYIGVSDGYGEGYYKELSRLAPTMGIELTTHEVYARSDASVTGQVLKVIATKPDAVFIASAGTPAVLPQRALRERGYKGPIYQTHGVATEEFIKLGGKDVEGAVFAGEVLHHRARPCCERSVQEADRGIYCRLQDGSQQPDAESVRRACLGCRAASRPRGAERAEGRKAGHAGIPRGPA